ncbi:class I SAM-dependent methyltransferase [Thermococcus onnurineus]|uniref:class I SAM-dependent methyltransferase n=1 Tax=Thermococcus onnurineus TaxID=342948 RepID=UPI00165018E7|nr:class I SAM-dependent methyltransferase [Thermococcus onnurineus]
MVEGISKTSKILDVGCGNGDLLFILRDIGFRNLLGVDPFIERDIVDNGVTILKRTIHELPGTQKFNLIMFHHSFEHLPDQLETLKKAKQLLADNGTILIRMPVKSDEIWKKYGVNWVQIDAPRHVIVHTVRSFEILSEKAGLKINKIIFDSTAFQFWGSELYKRGIPLEIGRRNLKKYFSYKQIKKWEKVAKELNKAQSGDQAIFYLKKR